MLQQNSFLWLDYSRLGVLVDRVARGLLAAGLHSGDAVVICGYARSLYRNAALLDELFTAMVA